MKQRLLFLGPPGAGKGTQAELLCQKERLLHLSTGDLLRAEVAAETSLGKQAALVMNRGELVSDDLVLSMVENRLNERPEGWLLDGFPRNVIQAESLEVLLEKIDQPIELVLFLDVDDELLLERLLARGRPDDTEDVIRHRLDVYREKTAPLTDYYSQRKILKTVKADGNIKAIQRSIEEVLNLMV